MLGLTVQIDDAFFPFMHEKLVTADVSGEYRDWAQLRIDALNRALKGIPIERTRYHICWGSWSGPHMFDVPLQQIIDIILQVNVSGYSSRPRMSARARMEGLEGDKVPAGRNCFQASSVMLQMLWSIPSSLLTA